MQARSKILVMMSFVLMALTSCDGEISMVTRIDKDGSCKRELSFGADSLFLTGNGFEEPMDNEGDVNIHHINLDDEWALTWGVKGQGDRNAFPMSAEQYGVLKEELKFSDSEVRDTLIVYAQRDFADVADMCAKTPLKFNEKPLSANGRLEKSFRWFYTDYCYTGTYECIAGNFKVPLNAYFKSEDEARYWLTGYPDLSDGRTPAQMFDDMNAWQKCLDKWTYANVAYDYFDYIARNHDSVENPSMIKGEFEAKRQQFIDVCVEKSQVLKEGILESALAEVLGDSYAKIGTEAKKQVKMLKYGSLLALQFKESIIMPGKVIDSGRGKYQDGAVVYTISAERMLPGDYVVEVRSRVVNVWAFVVTAFVVVVPFLLRLRRMKR